MPSAPFLLLLYKGMGSLPVSAQPALQFDTKAYSSNGCVLRFRYTVSGDDPGCRRCAC